MAGDGLVRIGAQLLDPPRDFLPGGNAFCVPPKGERTQLLGNVERGLVTMRCQNLTGAGPQLPFAQRHRWPRQ